MSPYARGIALNFTLGGVVAVLGLNLAVRIADVFPGSSLLAIAAFIASGAIGGASLRLSRGVAIGYGLCFLLVPALGFGFGFAMAQGGLFFVEGLMMMFGIPFFFAGLFGGAFTGRGLTLAASALGFGGGGVIGGALFFFILEGPIGRALFALPYLGERLDMLLLIAVPLIVPYALGGLLIGLAAQRLRASSQDFSGTRA